MGARHNAIGIKQSIRLEWMQKAADLKLAEISAKDIREELHNYLEDRMGSGSRGQRSPQARSFAVSILSKAWISPDPNLEQVRNSLLQFVPCGGINEIAAHWAMLCAAYPFWFNVAKQTGRLLGLQDQVTMRQIITRTVEEYGDRQTVTRNAQFVVRSFAYWNVIEESKGPGCYSKQHPLSIHDHNLASLILEAALLATEDGKGALGLLLNSPSFFPFQLPSITGDLLAQHNSRIEVVRYGMDDELLKLKDYSSHGSI